MNILYTNFHPRGSGGHGPYILNLARSLSPQHRITIATPGGSRLFALASALPQVHCVALDYSTRLLPSLLEVRRLRRLMRAQRYDIVHVNGAADHRHAMLARLGLRHPPRIVWTKHNTRPVGSLGNWVRAHLGTDGVIAVCDFVSRRLMASPYRGRAQRMIRLGVDTAHFHPASMQERAAARRQLFGELADEIRVLGSVGGTDYDKGWIFLVRALAALPMAARDRVRLVVAGNPPSQVLLDEVQALGVAHLVRFPGLVSDARQVLAASDLSFVLSLHEAGSYAVCESLSMGLPVLVSSAGGLPELIRDGVEGWILPPGDVSAIRAWLDAWLHEGTPPDFAAAARERATALFSMPDFAGRTLGFYERVLARGPAA